MILYAVDDKGGTGDPVGAGSHDRSEAAWILKIVLYILVPENDVLHVPVSVGRFKTYKHRAQVRDFRIQTVRTDLIQRDFPSVRESAKIILYNTHPQTSLLIHGITVPFFLPAP